MLKVIDDEKRVTRLARQFVAAFRSVPHEKIRVKLGHQGASDAVRVSYFETLDLWFYARRIQGGRHWRAFGLGRPKPDAQVSIVTEINFPEGGIDRKIGGALTYDASGRVFVVHRGLIGGSRKGIGKALFEQQYRGVWTHMEDGNVLSRVAVIGELRSDRFAAQVSLFVRKISALKAMAEPSPQASLDFPDVRFSEAFIGERCGAGQGDIGSRCDRDLVISELGRVLSKGGAKAGNDAFLDACLFDPSGNKISHVFAVSADNTEHSLLFAAASLLLRAAETGSDPVAVLIASETVLNAWRGPLARLGIRLAGFRFAGDRVVFSSLWENPA